MKREGRTRWLGEIMAYKANSRWKEVSTRPWPCRQHWKTELWQTLQSCVHNPTCVSIQKHVVMHFLAGSWQNLSGRSTPFRCSPAGMWAHGSGVMVFPGVEDRQCLLLSSLILPGECYDITPQMFVCMTWEGLLEAQNILSHLLQHVLSGLWTELS